MHKNLSKGLWRLNRNSNESAEIFIYGDIGGWDASSLSADVFAKEVAELDVETIDVRLNSGGGSVFEGQAIYNALSRHPAKVIMNIDGIAASIASVIAMAGDEIKITEGSHIMIHKPWSIAIGDAITMRKEAEVLDSLESGIVDIYAARTDKPRDKLEKWVEEETWFKGQAAVDAGFADEVIPAKRKEKAAQSNILAMYANTPIDLLDVEESPLSTRNVERLLRDVEGLSFNQAKRIANMVCGKDHDFRDGDDGSSMEQAKKLAKFIRSLT
jgi:ATP-dependent protease ClpP protease subunit